MPDIIQLLPDSIANQIAAGEVIQRPASVVKELMENAIDAGATSVKLILKDAGKTSIQVIDNGKGMSQTDARMAFERHATSKIRTANDLFSIRTMGFRGEALASIAAIAQVELVTAQADEQVGTRLIVEGSVVTKQEPAQSMTGSSITVKNLFYNVPARRKFLKSDPVELKHILDEFHRVVLASPEIHFSFHHNGNEVYHLTQGNLKQRIVGVTGKHINDKLIPVSEETDIVTIKGFIGKAEASRKTAGDQFIFVNNRYIKSNYLSHAIRAAFEDLITKDVFPTYFLYLDIDPAQIDINVHPTKTEIKFEDERLIYNYIRVSLKHALGQYSLTPMLDFSVDQNFSAKYQRETPQAEPKFENVEQKSFNWEGGAVFRPGQENRSRRDWEEVYKGISQVQNDRESEVHADAKMIEQEAYQLPFDESLLQIGSTQNPIQWQNTYILHTVKSGIMVIDQRSAHERILFEQYFERLMQGEVTSQKELFPLTVELSPAKASVLKNILDRVNALGFEMSEFGQNTFVIHGTPVGLDNSVSIEQVIEGILDLYVQNLEFELTIEDNLARAMAASSCIKRGRKLDKEEMINLIDQLFACQLPAISPGGKKCYVTIDGDDIAARFR
jgi:DNA mismatch repair protein MutL